VKGTYTLSSQGIRLVGPASTATGMYVLPGTYELDLTYTDAITGPQVQKQTFTL